MIAEVLATGEEIRSGALVDSNSAYIARNLEEAGVEGVRHSSVGDDPESIESILQEIAGRADIAVVTGGLGPTEDDRTREALAESLYAYYAPYRSWTRQRLAEPLERLVGSERPLALYPLVQRLGT